MTSVKNGYLPPQWHDLRPSALLRPGGVTSVQNGFLQGWGPCEVHVGGHATKTRVVSGPGPRHGAVHRLN